MSPVSSTVEPAGPGRRLGAFALDYLLFLGFLAGIGALGVLLTFGPLGAEWSALVASPMRMEILALCTTVGPMAAYFAISEASSRRATWGKRRMGLEVVAPDGDRLGARQAATRSVVKFLPWQMAHTAMLQMPGFPLDVVEPPLWTVGLLVLAWMLALAHVAGLFGWAGHRTLYDRMAGARVVER